MEKIKPTWTVLGRSFDTEEAAKAYLVKEEKIKKASQDLRNLYNFQKRKFNQDFDLKFSYPKDLARFLLENSLELQEVMEEFKL